MIVVDNATLKVRIRAEQRKISKAMDDLMSTPEPELKSVLTLKEWLEFRSKFMEREDTWTTVIGPIHTR